MTNRISSKTNGIWFPWSAQIDEGVSILDDNLSRRKHAEENHRAAGHPQVFDGIEHYIYTDYTPGLPSSSAVSFWIPQQLFLGYFTGGGLLLAGGLIITGKRAAEAAMALGILILTSTWKHFPECRADGCEYINV